MSDIPAKKLFHTLDQLKAELFPTDPLPPEEAGAKEGEIDEAAILANKLIDDLLKPPEGKTHD